MERVCYVIALAFLAANSIAKPSGGDVSSRVETPSQGGELCTSRQCTISAAHIANTMDSSVNPCDDFFSYACGDFAKKNDYKQTWETVSLRRKKASDEFMTAILESPVNPSQIKPERDLRNFFFACQRKGEEKVEIVSSLAEEMKSLNILPLIRTEWDEANFNLGAVLGKLLRIGSSALVSVDAEPDVESGYTKRIITIGHKNVLSKLTGSSQGAYKEYLDAALSSLLSDLNQAEYTAVVSNDHVNNVIHFEDMLHEIVGLSGKQFTRKTVQELKTLSSNVINWDELLEAVLEGTGISVDDSTVVNINSNYTSHLEKQLALTDNRVLADFLGISMLRSFVADVSLFADETPHGLFEGSSLTCLEKADLLMRYATTREYVKHWYPSVQPLNKAANNLYGLIKAAFVEKLDSSNTWTASEKEPIINHLNSLTTEIGYEDWILNDGDIEQYYGDLEITKNNHLKNLWELNQFLHAKKFAEINGPKLKEYNQFSTVIVTEALAMSDFAITIPITLLAEPYIYHGPIQTINAGSMGAILAFEVIRKINNLGLKLGEQTLRSLQSTSQCFSNLYSRHGLHVEEGVVMSSLMSEHEALSIAHVVASKLNEQFQLPGLENHQTSEYFWMAYGREMCENSFRDPNFGYPLNSERVKAVVANNRDFQTAFSCPKKADDACSLF